MIKLGICIDCQNFALFCGNNADLGIKKPITAQRCRFHYSIYRKKVCLERKKEMEKVKSCIKPQDKDVINLVYWYKDRMNECKGYCAECGEPISKIDRHSSIAHVLPKRKDHGFPSVATHPLNKLELGPRCGCHNRYDVSWLSASKMKIFPQAIEIVTILYPLLCKEEQARFPEVFQKYIL